MLCAYAIAKAIIDLIKAKRHRCSAVLFVLHKVGRVKVTQEVGGAWLPLAMHFGIGKDKHTHTHARREGERLQHTHTQRGTALVAKLRASHSQTNMLALLWSMPRNPNQLENLII